MMIEKDRQSPHPLVPANGYGRSNTDAARGSEQSIEARKKKRKKCIVYGLAFAVFQVAVILIFSLVVMKVRTPKFRVREATLETLEVGSTPANASFNMRMNAELSVKNANFGPYKFQNGTIVFSYRGMPVGELVFPKRKAGFRSTKKFDVVVDLTSSRLSDISSLGNDISSGILTITSQSRLNGKVELMWFMFKKKKATNMNCSLTVALPQRSIQGIRCQ